MLCSASEFLAGSSTKKICWTFNIGAVTILCLLSLKDDEYQTYDDQPLDELGVQQEAPEEEEEEEVVGGDEQQEDDNDTTAQDPQNFETEMVLGYLLCKCLTLWLSFKLV